MTGELMSDEFGKCERINSCGYFRYPTGISEFHFQPLPKNEEVEIKTIAHSLMESTFKAYQANPFYVFLSTVFTPSIADILCRQFHIGTAKNNGTIFWHVDKEGGVRNGKKMFYGLDGKRLKHIPPSALYLTEDGYHFPFFGEHQLINKKKVVGIVESEKTAVIASIYNPSIIWLACGGSNGLTSKKISVLKGREVLLYPDYDKAGRQAFYSKLELLSSICLVEIADDYPTLWNGYDIADIYLQSDLLSIDKHGNLINNDYPVLWDLPF